MKLLVLTIGDEEVGSTKYRIVQYADFLEENGVEITYVHRNDICKDTVALAAEADVVLNQKCLFKASLASKIIAVAKRVVFDFDDAIWTRPGRPNSLFTRLKIQKRFRLWLEKSDLIIAANEYLGAYAKTFTDRVQILPNSLDLQRWSPLAHRNDDGLIRIGWAGSPVNLTYLEELDDALTAICRKFPDVRIMVYCGEKPHLTCPFDYVPFKPGTEPSFTRGLDIGLLPIKDDEYLRGKSPIKSIQYLSCGVVVVGNVYGATAEILPGNLAFKVDDPESWGDVLEKAILAKDRRQEMVKSGLDFVHLKHDMKNNRKKLLQLLTGE